MSLNFKGCGCVRRWNPAACSTSLGSHIPTPLTFQLPGWEVEAAASSHPWGPGLGGAGLSRGSLSGGRRRRGQWPGNPESLNGGASSTDGEGAAVPAATSFPSLFPGLCSSAVTLPGGETEKARERRPKATPGELSSWDGDPLDPTALYPPFPAPGSQPRAAAPSRAPGFCCICWCRAAGGVCNKSTDKNPGCQIRMHLLPLDRRTIFSRNVFCGATSPFLPPAMVILPAARGLGGRPGTATHGSSKLGAGPASDPGWKRPMRSTGTRAGRGGGGSLRLPPSRPLRASLPAARLAVYSRGARRAAAASGWAGGSRSNPARGAPYRARVPRRPAGDRAGRSRSGWEAERRGGPRLDRQRRALAAAGKRAQGALWVGWRGGRWSCCLSAGSLPTRSQGVLEDRDSVPLLPCSVPGRNPWDL